RSSRCSITPIPGILTSSSSPSVRITRTRRNASRSYSASIRPRTRSTRAGAIRSSRSHEANSRSLIPPTTHNTLLLINTALPRVELLLEVRRAIAFNSRSLRCHQFGPRIGNSAILQAIGQLLHQRALLSRQVRRREDFQLVEQVAGRLPAARRQSAPAQSHHASRLAAGRNLERHASVNGGRGDFGAERRFVVPHRQTHPQITARNREHGVKFDSNREKQIAILIGT